MRHEVSYVYFAEPGAPQPSAADMPFCREIQAVSKPPAYTPVQMVRGVLGRTPLPVLNYRSEEMAATVARLTKGRRLDAIHVSSLHMVRYAETAARESGGRVFHDWHNIESEAMRRYCGTLARGPRRWYAWQTAGKLEAVERAMLRDGFGHFVCSERERAQLAEIAPKARIAAIENGVDTAYFAGSGARGRKLVFVGSMDYYPNVEAAVSFARNLWPTLRARLPGSSLAIVGANPAAPVRALASEPGVTVTGTVPDIRPWYGDALAAVVPLRTGGGTRLKILEAMAAGVPVVSSSLGAEGLAVTPGRDLLISEPDDLASWADNLNTLMESPARWDEIRDSGLRLARDRYDWERLGQTLADTFSDWLGRA